ncbi:hypothetical protein [Cellulomonas cellasea]|uniref:Luciferase-like domain-containing protein n=2 Tax=Cellulomonas cellasea TaxID=43670 RepID=A0A0A0B4V3_9CELL|nr:hypothetical protein [Cellulomonas cellasea]KGM01218.1 hypothetical protein Q760_02985 [Cellulomonas cellasea DSM 20118]GEA87817.1 hypothetical protein CCE01nite_17660 [Cellulomonas cellasea]
MSQLVLDRLLPDMSTPTALDGAAALDRAPAAGREAATDSSTPVRSAASDPADLRAAPDAARRVTVAVAAPGDDRPHAGDPVAFRPTSGVALALAAARADAVHLSFSAQVPTVAAMAELVEQLEDEIAAVGRERAGVSIVLDLDVLPTADADVARRKRSYLEHLDALAGLTWKPSATRVVAAPEAVVGAAVDLARRVGVDGVVLVPLADGPAVDHLRALAPVA